MRCSSRLVALTVVVLAIGVVPSSAQGVGARGGINWSNIVFDDPGVLAVQPQLGMVAGGFITFRPDRTVGLQVEALLSRRSIKFETSIEDAITYLELPVLVRVAAYRGDTLVIQALGGVSANVLLSAKEHIPGLDPADIKAAMEPWEVAVVVGADAELKRRWIIGFRYLYGLTQTYVASDVFPSHQQGFQVTAGYRFR